MVAHHYARTTVPEQTQALQSSGLVVRFYIAWMFILAVWYAQSLGKVMKRLIIADDKL